jgi:hypothetical protein
MLQPDDREVPRESTRYQDTPACFKLHPERVAGCRDVLRISRRRRIQAT